MRSAMAWLNGAPRDAADAILVLGQSRDPQVSAVVDRLTSHGVTAHVLDYYQYTSVSIDFPDPGEVAIEIGGTRLPTNLLIWDRSKFFVNTSYYFDDREDGETDAETRRRHQLQETEWKGSYQLLMTLPGIQYVSHPLLRNGMLKPVQQLVANDLGMATPPSLVSNDKVKINRFFEKHPRSVLKSLSGGRFERREDQTARTDMLMTMAVDANQVDEAPASAFEKAPHFFQKNISKAYEIRLFAYEGGAHAFSVDSQKANFTSTDWRHGASLLRWEACAIPTDIHEATQAFLKYFGLFYGSFDFIVTPDNQWVFLECNRDGQWAWLDRIKDHELSKGLADAIAGTWFEKKGLNQ